MDSLLSVFNLMKIQTLKVLLNDIGINLTVISESTQSEKIV